LYLRCAGDSSCKEGREKSGQQRRKNTGGEVRDQGGGTGKWKGEEVGPKIGGVTHTKKLHLNITGRRENFRKLQSPVATSKKQIEGENYQTMRSRVGGGREKRLKGSGGKTKEQLTSRGSSTFSERGPFKKRERVKTGKCS